MASSSGGFLCSIWLGSRRVRSKETSQANHHPLTGALMVGGIALATSGERLAEIIIGELPINVNGLSVHGRGTGDSGMQGLSILSIGRQEWNGMGCIWRTTSLVKGEGPALRC